MPDKRHTKYPILSTVERPPISQPTAREMSSEYAFYLDASAAMIQAAELLEESAEVFRRFASAFGDASDATVLDQMAFKRETKAKELRAGAGVAKVLALVAKPSPGAIQWERGMPEWIKGYFPAQPKNKHGA